MLKTIHNTFLSIRKHWYFHVNLNLETKHKQRIKKVNYHAGASGEEGPEGCRGDELHDLGVGDVTKACVGIEPFAQLDEGAGRGAGT